MESTDQTLTKDGTKETKRKATLPPSDIEKFVIYKGSDNVKYFGGQYEGGIHCQQKPDEIAGLISFLSDKDIKDYLEVGVASGGTTYLIDHYLKPSRIVLMDDNKHPKTSVRYNVLAGVKYKEIIGDSHDEKSLKQLTGRFDLVFLDGDNSYYGSGLDIRNLKPLIKKGGYLALHDSNHYASPGVKRRVNELKNTVGVTFVKEWLSESDPIGIALFQMGGHLENNE